MAAPPRPGLARAGSSIASANKTIVLVTGANTGIGYEIVKNLATLRSDYQILLGARDVTKGEEAAASMGAPINVNPIQIDITDEDSVMRCYKAIEQHFGRLDVLINNAGTAGNDLKRTTTTPTMTSTYTPSPRVTWSHIMNVNVVGTGLLTETMLPLLQNSKAPRIIFITSSLGSIGQVLKDGKSMSPETVAYNASKAAVNMMTVNYATRFPGIKVNACCPGLRATGLHADPEAIGGGESDPALGAVNAVRLATEVDGASGTYTDSEGVIPW